jgi:hypothetical protein
MGGMSEDPPAVGPWAVLVFVCELAMLAGLAVAGFRLAPAGPMAYALMVALPIAVAVIWGLLLAPRSAKGLRGRAATVGKSIVFVIAGVLLALTGLWPWGLALVVVAVLALVMADHEAAAPTGQ